MSVASSAAGLRAQWSEPTGIFTILLIIGADVVQRAIAGSSGRYITPVTFAFGWVSYGVSATMSAFGKGTLMPDPDSPCLVINARSGYIRSNHSWMLSRLLRDFEYWRDERVDAAEKELLKRLEDEEMSKPEGKRKAPRVGLRVTVYDAEDISGIPKPDWVYWMGFLTIAVQLGVAAIPWAKWGQWLTFFVTGVGTILALLTASLPQWREERTGVRKLEEPKDVTLTTGNGAHDVLAIIGNPGNPGMDIEALASPHRKLTHKSMTKLCTLLLAIGWLALLISVAGSQEHTWFLVGVGMLGILHNILVASAPRKPHAHGFHILYKKTFVARKVMEVLYAVETEYPGMGASLQPTFFPGKLFPREQEIWDYARRRRDAWEKARRPPGGFWDMPPLMDPEGVAPVPVDGPYSDPRGQTGSQSSESNSSSMDKLPPGQV